MKNLVRLFCKTKRNLYQLLNIQPNVSMDQLRSRYLELAKIYHPDVNKEGKQRFQEITHAFDILSEEKSRIRYDRSIGMLSEWQPTNVASQHFENQQRYQEMLNSKQTARHDPDGIFKHKLKEHQTEIAAISWKKCVPSLFGLSLGFFILWNGLLFWQHALQRKTRDLSQQEQTKVDEAYRVRMLPLNIT